MVANQAHAEGNLEHELVILENKPVILEGIQVHARRVR